MYLVLVFEPIKRIQIYDKFIMSGGIFIMSKSSRDTAVYTYT